MQFSRPRSLRAGIIGLLAALPILSQQPTPQQHKPPNPFEQVPQAAEEPKPLPPKPDQAKPLTAATPDRPPTDNIESINFRGARKVPQDTLRAMIFTKRGDAWAMLAMSKNARGDSIMARKRVWPSGSPRLTSSSSRRR